MAKMLKVIVAGPLVVQAIYPVVSPKDSDGFRAGKRRMSSEAQKRMNLKYAYQRLELEMAANFVIGDLVITLTYDNAHLPQSRREAQRKVQVFWRKLATARRARDAELKYLYVNESKHDAGRWHHHSLINATGEDYNEIIRLWRWGSVEIHPFRVDRDKNFETLARYFCKEAREKVGQRLWSCSRNLLKPERDSWRVGNDVQLEVPKGATLLEDTGDVRTTYGHYRYIKYLGRGWTIEPSKVKARRRRRKPKRA